MASGSTSNTSRPGLSLYANLLDSNGSQASAPGTISRAPVVFKQPDVGPDKDDGDSSAVRQQPSAASLRFQPTKRPQTSNQKARGKPALPKADPLSGRKQVTSDIPTRESNAASVPPVKSTLSDWAAEQEDEAFYPAGKRQRGGRKKRRKTKESPIVHNWDDIYDPSRPNSYEEYQYSDEKISEIREWKDRLYTHRINNRSGSMDSSSSSDGIHDMQRTKSYVQPGLSFAPPTNLGTTFTAAETNDHATGDDIYARRLRLSNVAEVSIHANNASNTERPLPVATEQVHSSHPDRPDRSSPRIQSSIPSISRGPIRYNLPPPPPEIPNSEAEFEDALLNEETEAAEPHDGESPRSLRPGQRGFAERLMSKYGWTKGSGLGAGGTGIVNPLRVQIEKQKKKPDSEGGGFIGPGGRGKIIGSKNPCSKSDSEGGKWGIMSEVIILHGMLRGLDLDAEMERAEDGGLMQEIGDECGEKYGRVERVFINRGDSSSPPVFVKFTSQLSALRAVNALEGRIFNGNPITARFYDLGKFDLGVYE
ncbi:MAG: hypothetical protein Q9184_004346 [Pyrenodesmia sp. 2 TL-2023]